MPPLHQQLITQHKESEKSQMPWPRQVLGSAGESPDCIMEEKHCVLSEVLQDQPGRDWYPHRLFPRFFCTNFPQPIPVRSTRHSSTISHWGLSTLLSDLQRLHGGGEQKLETNHRTLPHSPLKKLFQISVGRCCCLKNLNTEDSQDPQPTMICFKCLFTFGENTVRLLKMDYRR